MKIKLMYLLCIVFLLWVAVSTVEVWIHNATETEKPYSDLNVWAITVSENKTEIPDVRQEIAMTVVSCDPIEDYYEVVVEDYNGNQWAYYDTDFQASKTQMLVTIQGKRVIDAVTIQN